jgi:hypothetical protein
MADSAVLKLAKGMLSYDSKTLDSLFSECETPALLMLSKYLSIEDLSVYVGQPTLTYTKVEASDADHFIRLYVNRTDAFRPGDVINIVDTDLNPLIYAGIHVIVAVDYVDGFIVVRGEFTETETGTITNSTNERFMYAHAYLILSKLAIHSQSIVKGDVIFSSQQFGQGNMAPASQSEKKFLSDRYFQEAMNLINNQSSFVV